MPTYDYTCLKCGHEFEAVQSISADPLAMCPKDLCKLARWGRGKVKRGLGGGAGLLFKGSGFYITDYRSENYKTAAKKESDAASSKTSSATTPKEGKPSSGAGAPAKKD